LLIINNGLEFTWTAQIRADVEFELLRKMRRAGCRLAVVGFESGSDGVLKMMKKAITVDQSRRFARAARKRGFLFMATSPSGCLVKARKLFRRRAG